MGGITQYLSFCFWQISLSIVSSGLIYVVAGVRISTLWLNNIPSYGWITLYLSIHQSLDTWLVSTRVLLMLH